MALTAEKRKALISESQRKPEDTGSVEVQVTLLSENIKLLTEHCKVHDHDFDSRDGLIKAVNQRRSLLRYLKKEDHARYANLIEKLGIRETSN